MATSATATFQIAGWDEDEIMQTDGSAKVTRATVSRTFEGDIEGTGTVEWLMAYDDGGSATFVGIERIVGSIVGRTGSVVLRHVGAFDGQMATADLLVVAGSGTGELRGVRGEGSFEAGLGPEGKRHISLDVEA
jgi:Protein of unknown function (DUF3224)